MRKSHRILNCVLITVFLFFVLVVLDIAVVESIFRPFKLWNAIWMWYIVFATLVIVLPIAVCIWMQTHLPLYIPLLNAFGLEDTAFYLLQLQLPTYYVGVSILGIWEPNRYTVLMLNLVGVALVGIIELLYHAFFRGINGRQVRRRLNWGLTRREG